MASTSSTSPSTQVDVLIIGAGLAGLTAARTLHNTTNANLKILVLEARNRVGGRTYSHIMPTTGAAIDIGAAWINDTNQERMWGLVGEFGLGVVEQNTEGRVVLLDAGRGRREFGYGETASFDDATKKQLEEIRDMVEADCQAVSASEPRSSEMDAVSADAYVASRGAGPEARATVSVWTRAMLGRDSDEVSALCFLHYLKCGGGLMLMRSDRKGGGQALRIKEGTQEFSKRLVGSLPEGMVVLGAPVWRVRHVEGGGVEVEAGGRVYCAKKVVSSIAPPALKEVVFEPPLPAEKKRLVEGYGYGFYEKVMMVFRRPLWVERGYCGLAQSFEGPITIIRDTSVPEKETWVLTCFMCGRGGAAWGKLGIKEREEALLKHVGEIFGDEQEVREEYVESVKWDEGWGGEKWNGYGCPSSSLQPGANMEVGIEEMGKPWRDMAFVGTETSDVWKGYMEGAVRSGERGAREVLEALGHKL